MITVFLLLVVFLPTRLETYIVKEPRVVETKYNFTVPYEVTEIKKENKCDLIENCSCTKKSWLGLGTCYECECHITKERIESGTRTETIYNLIEHTKKVNWIFGYRIE